MLKNKEVEEIVKKKYLEISSLEKEEDFIDKDRFGEIKIFINKKPSQSLLSFEFTSLGDPSIKDTVYLGSN